MSKYKIIITLILFCLFQATPSISLELKIPKLGDLKKITEDIKKELEKKEPEVKKKEVKKEEVKKEEVKKEEVKKEEVKELDKNSFFNKSFYIKGIRNVSRCHDETYYFFDDYTARLVIICSDTGEVFTLGIIKWKFIETSLSDNSQVVEIRLIEEEKSGKITAWNDILRLNLKNSKAELFLTNQNITSFYNIINIEDTNKESAEKNIAKKSAQNEKKQTICEDKDFTKSKNLGGYKNFYFGMPIEDALKFKMCVGEFMIADETGGGGPLRLNKLYNEKHEVQIYFENDKVDMIALRLFSDLDYAQTYSFGVTSIEKFEQIKKVVLDKYKLIAKPEKNSIDEFNKEKYANLTWTLKDRDFEILLQLTKSPPLGTAQTFFYKGWISYLSPDRVKKMLEKKDGEKVKSDDL